MKLAISYGGEVFALPAAAAAYLDKADPLTLRLFLLLCADKSLRESFDPAALARSFAVTPEKIGEALAFWQNAGLLTAQEGTVSAPLEEKKLQVSVKSADNGSKVTVVTGEGMPNYSGREIEALMAGDASLSLLIEECQRIAGKLFGAREISRLLGLSDYLRLDHDSILLLFAYAARLGKCSLPYIEKVAANMVNEGITSYAEIEAYITHAEKKHTLEEKVRKLAGLSQRAFSAKEKKFIEGWCQMDFPFEMLEMAYEITVNNTGNFAFPYMNKVLLNWREAGYTTVDEVNAALGAYREKRERESDRSSFDVNEFFEAALKRSYDRMEQERKPESSGGVSFK